MPPNTLSFRHIKHEDTLAARSLKRSVPLHPDEAAERPPIVARAEGDVAHGVDGRRYLDGVGSWWVNLVVPIRRALDRVGPAASRPHHAGGDLPPTSRLVACLKAGGTDRSGPCVYAVAPRRPRSHWSSAHYWRNTEPTEMPVVVGVAGSYQRNRWRAGRDGCRAVPRKHAPLVRLCPPADARLVRGRNPLDDIERSSGLW
jgi:hypothetical protein